MKETIVRAQCGLNTAVLGQKSIHSRYNPQLEAKRYVDSLNFHGGFRYVILAECGLAYVIEPLRQKSPDSKIISLHLREFYAGKSASPPDAEWSPASSVSLNSFLENEIDDIEANKIKIIEWRPAADMYGVEYLTLIKKIAAFVKRIDANKRTRAAFGRRWFKNVLKNCFLFGGRINTRIVRRGGDCVIAGAGPALNDAYDAIRQLTKNGALLIAVSSAASALLQAGLRPDVIVACDGGSWAPLHLFESVRFFCGGNTPYPVLAFSLSAALPSQCAGFNLLPISDESLFQSIARQCFDFPHLSFPQRGTVSASAVDVAFRVSGGAVYTAGINFSHRDIRSHVKPYAFDALLSDAAGRFTPLYALQFERARTITESGANGIYAAWFSSQNYPRKIYSITDECADKKRVSNSETRGGADVFDFSLAKPVSRPVTKLISALIAALESPVKEKLSSELSDMLPDLGGSLEYDRLRAELLRVSKKYRAIEERYG
ncbi:MAG: DUF115 domain-containing protein [Spirochaetaceae bacterium]|jgi:hypothetical protein|nr:DUF115 domain-containing protein [Spirochaetaceae bacterium]